MVKIENAWFPKSSTCSETSTTITSNSLGMESFWGLFLIVGITSALAFFSYLFLFLHQHKNILTNSQISNKEKLLTLKHCFDNKDLKSHTFRNNLNNNDCIVPDRPVDASSSSSPTPLSVQIITPDDDQRMSSSLRKNSTTFEITIPDNNT